jgi:hypothetical protein
MRKVRDGIEGVVGRLVDEQDSKIRTAGEERHMPEN